MLPVDARRGSNAVLAGHRADQAGEKARHHHNGCLLFAFEFDMVVSESEPFYFLSSRVE